MLQVRLLGQFDVRAEGKRISIPTRAGQSLFAFLVLNPGVEYRREQLAGLFWPDSSEENARRSLRTELWRLRKTISAPGAVDDSPASEYFLTTDIAITFNRDADYWLDAAQLLKPVGDLESLTSELALYRGELLPGFYDEWVSLEREHLYTAFENKMQQLLERLCAQERWVAVQDWAEKWLALDTAPEPAYRALMMAYGARGDTAQVTAVYQRCGEELQAQLGVEPSAETRALYETLRQGVQVPARISSAQPFGTVTFLFTDIEGSTRLLEALGQDYATVLAEHQAILRAAIYKWNGQEQGTQGDSFFVSFARALDAVQCTIDAQRALAAHSWTRGHQVRVRMGLHTGEPLIAATGYIGMDVHRAARIGDAGHGGQVLLSQTTRELVQHELPSDVTIRDLGEFRLKDLKFPTPLFQLVIAGLQNDFPPLRTKLTGTN